MIGEIALTLAVLALAVAAVMQHRAFLRHLQAESTANRHERAEMMQRIQAPDAAVIGFGYQQAAQVVSAGEPQEDDLERIDKEWAESDESVVAYDEDLADLG